tara:strand:+ start:669 stop:857 length:189 start_codon:yes stop_codon:yes gene_type:complete
MNRKKAIEICRSLLQTMEKMPNGSDLGYLFETPRAKKENLKKIYKRLVKKYKIKENDMALPI